MERPGGEDLTVQGSGTGPSPAGGSSGTGAETWFRRLTFFSLLSGLCPLIPAPFLDDWVLNRVRMRMGREILGLRGLEAGHEELRVLLGIEKRELWQGCLSTAVLLPLFKLTIYLLKKVIRKIVIILTLKECSDRFSETFHEGYLLHAATVRGDLGGGGRVSGEVAVAIRSGVVRACRAVDPRPINQLVKRGLRGSRWLLVTGSRRLVALFRRGRADPQAREAGLEGEERLLATLVERLSRALWLQSGYWEALEGHYLRAVENLRRQP